MMKIVQINTALNSGSHGRIVEQVSRMAAERGFETTIVHGARYVNKSQFTDIQVTTKNQELLNGVRSLMFDAHGLGLRCATKSLITKLKAIKPDIVHLHNIHGYYLNYQILFDYLANTGIPVVWTLHDCWSMTGHCAYFDAVNCNLWQTGCHSCPQLESYPKAFLDNTKRNYELKKKCFTKVKNMTLVPVSNWLEGIVKQSYLSDYPTKVIHNGIDLSSFRPSEASGEISSNQKFTIIGVTANWEKRKGFDDFIKLRRMLNDDYEIVMVGLDDKKLAMLPPGIKGLKRTESVKELAELYSSADVFVNTTYEDNFPTTNLEALACGTPVITYKTGGSPEAVSPETGIVVEKGDMLKLVEAIESIKAKGKHCYSTACRERAVSFYNKDDRFKDYIDLYENILNNSDI